MTIRRRPGRGRSKIMIVAALAAGLLAAGLSASAAVASATAGTTFGQSSVSAQNEALLARAESNTTRPIGPFTITTPQGKLTYGWRPGRAVTNGPLSASPCDFDVCLVITGTGLHVTDWDTSAFYGGTGTLCTRAAWHQNGAIIRTGPTICGKGPGTFYSAWTPNKNFPNDTLACNGWTNVKGYPCATIHS